MVRFSLYLVCGLVLGAVLVNAISQEPGYLLVTWGDWQLETSVWLALSALMLSIGIDEMDLGVVGGNCFEDRFGEP